MKIPSGIRLEGHKDYILSEPRIRVCETPKRIVIPVASSELIVSIGENILRGQKITNGLLPLRATTSGTVTAIEPRPHPQCGQVLAVDIEADGKDASIEDLGRERSDSEIESMLADDLRYIARENGIANLDSTDIVIINGSESEPYLTADYLLMQHKPVEILRGVEFLLRASGAKEAVIAISEDMRQCYEIFASKMFTHKIQKIRLHWLKSTYPQGFDIQLTAQILDKPRRLAQDAGAAIFSVPQAFAFFEAVKFRKPFLERVVTVAGGCVMQPQNVWARFGTSFKDVFEQCGNFLRFPSRVIMNGPMTGVAQDTLDVPVIPATCGVLAFPKEENILEEAAPCIRCGECIPVCPVSVNSAAIVEAVMNSPRIRASSFHPENCIECGNCSYICPSKIPVMDLVLGSREAL
ncbi:MAG: RnfABCDGE type electron transport complex subunit C [Candidatus Omnitrophica bacterium]|nr:RnfABCDGE type electron transport complex subunit C [Candidatus Omnitrophota bacterium]